MADRVVVVHDYLTQRGGAERVALELLRAFPSSRMVTSLYEPDSTFSAFADHDIQTLWPNRIGSVRRHHRAALPLLHAAFSAHVITDADVVICSSSGWAHMVGATVPKIVYCHNPPRWLHQPGDYLEDHGLATRVVMATLRRRLAGQDKRAALTAERYLANSTGVAQRIAQVYGVDAEVVHPPCGIDPSGPQQAVEGLPSPFFLTVSRRRGYKNTAQVAIAAERIGAGLVVVGGLDGYDVPREKVVSLVNVTDAQLRWLYSNCVALVGASYEDFGLTPIEANACGRPALTLRAGGYLDSVSAGVNGEFFAEPTAGCIAQAMLDFRPEQFDGQMLRATARRFAPENFADDIRRQVADLMGDDSRDVAQAS